ncbi:DUF2381 family protein [Pyxidicoccus xibeiensis]|uniref:DUF2381 family protein n=1 Tax=Pyxidicoccus xibeiensis TaxID=2906759 RepID=UPI0020A70A10|nr:DUF2381 family protein [Pyxidicoccus xibeiensis]MCP3144188.1 DUF2381 family protein [Pyxidicoccus xibeiensis]
MCLPISVVLVVLMGTAAPEVEAKRVEARREVRLAGDALQDIQVLRLAPGTVTLVLFDSSLAPESTDTTALQPLLERMEVNERSLVLKPRAELKEATVGLTVRFKDGHAPEQVAFTLVSHPDVVDTQVEVLRKPRPAEWLLAELTSLRGRCAAAEAGLAALRRQCAASGLVGAYLSGELDLLQDITVRMLEGKRAVSDGLTSRPGMPLILLNSGPLKVLGVELSNPPGHGPWVAGRARLVRLDPEGRALGAARELPVHVFGGQLAPGETARLAVRWEEPEGEQAAAVSLELMDVSGRRGIRWERLEL